MIQFKPLTSQQMNILSNLDDIASVIIRPSRYLYKLTDLGSKSLEDGTITRTDFEVKNSRQLKLKCSMFSKVRPALCENILIYLHCNSGSRIEGQAYLKYAMENDLAYIVFDFSGSGLSQGKFVSLGFYQTSDLQTIIKYVRSNMNPKARIALWGRSMGAVTALRYLAKVRNQVTIAVFDSPFYSLEQLFLEIGKQKTNIPKFLLSIVYKYLKPVILEKAGFDIDEVSLQDLLETIACRGIFIASKNDDLIPFKQIDDIFSKYNSEKEMFFIDESHNETRNAEVIQKVFRTMKQYLQVSKHNEAKNSYLTMVGNKDTSKKKLQLTIKSLSQRLFKVDQPADNSCSRAHEGEGLQMKMDRRQASCLFPREKCRGTRQGKDRADKENKESPQFAQPERGDKILVDLLDASYRPQKLQKMVANRSESFLQTKKKPLMEKKFFRENVSAHNIEQIQNHKPKFTGEARVITVKLESDKERSRERKTFQHITNKRPPYVELKSNKQRSSFEGRYRT